MRRTFKSDSKVTESHVEGHWKFQDDQEWSQEVHWKVEGRLLDGKKVLAHQLRQVWPGELN